MATRWEIRFVRSAERELDQLPESERREAIQVIADLREDPVPSDAKALKGLPYHRIPFGNHQFRIVYRILRDQNLIRIMRIRPRRTAYRGYPS